MQINRRRVLGIGAVAAAIGLVGLPMLPVIEEDILSNETKLSLGKRPVASVAKLKFGDYLNASKLPTPPANYGHPSLVKDWQVLGNDDVGDCAFAGPMHAIMLWNAEAKKKVNINTAITLAAYSAITGYDPAQTAPGGYNPTDRGADIVQVAEYWQKHGLTDCDGNIHKVDAYLALEPRNVEELFYAMYLFDGVGIGVSFPEQWMDDFKHGQVWDTLADPMIAGGHYVLGVGRKQGNIQVVTWGKTQLMTQAAYEQFNDETLIYLNEEDLVDGKTMDGFDLDQLKADLEILRNEPLMCPAHGDHAGD